MVFVKSFEVDLSQNKEFSYKNVKTAILFWNDEAISHRLVYL